MIRTTNIARPLAPEDIRRGVYVTLLHVMTEFLPFSLCDEPWRRPEIVRTLWLPHDGGVPMKVVEVCLPFVLVEKTDGTHTTLDVRRVRLAALSERFGRRAFKRIKPEPVKAFKL